MADSGSTKEPQSNTSKLKDAPPKKVFYNGSVDVEKLKFLVLNFLYTRCELASRIDCEYQRILDKQSPVIFSDRRDFVKDTRKGTKNLTEIEFENVNEELPKNESKNKKKKNYKLSSKSRVNNYRNYERFSGLFSKEQNKLVDDFLKDPGSKVTGGQF